MIIQLIIISGQFIKHHKWWFGPQHQGRFDISTMMGRECSRLDPSYQRHIHIQAATNYTPITVSALLPSTYRLYQFTDPEKMDLLVS